VYTSGKSKSTLDPFREEKPEDVARMKVTLEQVHKAFIDHVTARRGDKFSADEDLFSGEYWVGQKAVELGLADAIGHLVPVLKDRYGDKVHFRVYGQKKSLAQRLGTTMFHSAANILEEKAAFARFGL
jgi:ClpP class serine protease